MKALSNVASAPWKLETRHCKRPECGIAFGPQREKQAYCTPFCRNKHWRDQQQRVVISVADLNEATAKVATAIAQLQLTLAEVVMKLGAKPGHSRRKK